MTRIDRRALFATGSAAALLAAVGVSAGAPPARGGHLRAALSGGDRSESWLDVPGGRFLQTARNAVFESLAEVAPDGTLQPGLASAWQADKDYRIWQFSIASGVRFHDGSALTTEDVVASLRAFGFRAQAADRDSVIVDLEAGDPALPFRLARDGVVVFRDAELAEGTLQNGTGLYRIRRFDTGRGFLGERVAQHRKDGQAGWFDTVELVSISADDVRAEAVRDGIVDVADIGAAYGLEQRSDLMVVRDGGNVIAAVSKDIQTATRAGPHPLDDMRFVERWWRRV